MTESLHDGRMFEMLFYFYYTPWPWLGGFMKINIGLVDDHQLFRKSLSLLLGSLNGFSVVVEAQHGKELQDQLGAGSPLPDIMLIDVNMPVMNGLQTAQWLRTTYPAMRMVGLSMNEIDQTIIDMLKAGCCTYLPKDTHPDQLKTALHEIYLTNYYNSCIHKTHLSDLVINHKFSSTIQIGDRERQFLQHASSDLTYKEIAERMDMSQRTIDGYRESLFAKFRVQSRTGMVLEAIKRGFVMI